ncbi:hypothetical protein V1264_020355 [Littorina saxatilis]|uniref:G/T mismatch-specific thymine DNA glycosylase n=2 Tax=Littorina saxatilis TaxID=31220 RepID=A0AAN9BAX0_9CAEN
MEADTAQDTQIQQKKGRKKKTIKGCDKDVKDKTVLKQEKITDHMPVEKKRRKIDRFNGMPEEEVILKLLPDRLTPNLDILIVGINPGLYAAYIGHHYAGPGNHFWKCLYLSGLVPEPMNCYDDIKLQEFGIGFTNMCARTTRGSVDLKKQEVQEGGQILVEKLKEHKPKIAVFNGKGIYEIFSGKKKFTFGKQPELIEGTDTIAYVMPSSSARCAQLPRAIDKVPFYEALRKLRDYVTGRIPHIDEADVTFPTLELKNVKKEDPGLKEEIKAAAGLIASQGDMQQNGSDLSVQVTVKQEGKKPRGRPAKGKGKKKKEEVEVEEEENGEDEVVIGESFHQQNQFQGIVPQVTAQQLPQQHPQMFQNFFHPRQGLAPQPQSAATLPLNQFSSADFASLLPAGSASQHNFPQSFQAPFMSFPGMAPAAAYGVAPQSQLPPDFLSGFDSGSQQFGMVGGPTVVSSMQNMNPPLTNDLTGQQSVQIKSEPAE